MTASAVEVGSRKKEKAKRPSESKEILLGCYIRLGPGSQELCVYLGIERLRRGKPISWNFGIKPFYPKIGGHVSTQNFRPVPSTHAASRKGLLDRAVDPPSFSAGVVDPTHSSRDVPVNLTL